jgi:uncharacterized membrane protein YozB (DUF420 family)
MLRRAHILLWIAILPLAFAALIHAWQSRNATPFAEIPAAVATEAP